MKHYTIADFARMGNYSLQYVYGMARTGRLRGAQKINGEWVIPFDSMLPFLRKRAATLTEEDIHRECPGDYDQTTAVIVEGWKSGSLFAIRQIDDGLLHWYAEPLVQ